VTEWDTLIGDWWFEEMEELQEGDRETFMYILIPALILPQ
jgi:hypothetical protein